MIRIAGSYFDGQSATPQSGWLSIDSSGRILIDEIVEPVAASLSSVTISDRIGNVPRRFLLPNGATFETSANDEVDRALAQCGGQHGAGVVHWLEQRWPVAIGALLSIALISFAFVQYGVPALADLGARVTPPKVDRALGAQGLQLLDRTLFKPSTLPSARQTELKDRFVDMTRTLRGDGHEYRLELRSSPRIGPNAMALPSGIVVMTDQLVRLAKNDDELAAILAHEVGHVRHRHTLRLLLRSTGISAISVAVLGDVSAVSGLVSAIPALGNARFSREFEREADSYAKQWLRASGIPESRFDDILCRMTKADSVSSDPSVFDYMSSHPPPTERARCGGRMPSAGRH
jgi:Zn-dependent protease with chaperone function